MATTGSYFYIEPENITLEMEYSGTTPVSSGWIYLDTSIFPQYYTSDNFTLIADNYSSGDGTITITTTADGVDNSTTLGDVSYLSIYRDHIITRFKVDVVGRNNQSSGLVYLRYLSEQIYITYDSSKKPVMNITSISNNKISAVEGHDECIVKFYSDLTLEKAEVRATLTGSATGHGVGLLVEELGGMYAGVIYSATIENEELTNGDNNYTISIFGKTTQGIWSETTVNLLDLARDVDWTYNASISNNIVSYNTGTSHVEFSGISIDLYLNGVYQDNVSFEQSIGNKTFIFNKDSSFDSFALVLSGDNDYGGVKIDVSMDNGESYLFSYTIDSLTLNTATVSNLSIVKVVS